MQVRRETIIITDFKTRNNANCCREEENKHAIKRDEINSRYLVKVAFSLLVCSVHLVFLLVQSTQCVVQLALRTVQLSHK